MRRTSHRSNRLVRHRSADADVFELRSDARRSGVWACDSDEDEEGLFAIITLRGYSSQNNGLRLEARRDARDMNELFEYEFQIPVTLRLHGLQLESKSVSITVMARNEKEAVERLGERLTTYVNKIMGVIF